MSTIASYSPLNIWETVRDRPRGLVPEDHHRIWPAVTIGSRRCGLSKCLYYQLRQLRQAVRSLSEDASKTLVQACVSCRLDYCNSASRLNRLQLVQNAAACLITGTRRSDITQLVRQLHWATLTFDLAFR